MTREDDFDSQIRAALEERTYRGRGWISLPSPDPIRDFPMIARSLEKYGRLEDYSIAMFPSEDIGGWWDIVIVSLSDTEEMSSRFPEELRRSRGRSENTGSDKVIEVLLPHGVVSTKR